MKEVELNISNYSKCLCPVCPVEADSPCLYTRQKTWRDARRQLGKVLKQYPEHPEAYEMPMQELEASDTGKDLHFAKPAPANMRELFCSEAVGRSDCQDLSGERTCQCPDCMVWEGYRLGSGYFCVRGSAA
ncbi:MAG: DUF2769 domain-containing protein [Actinobacteria bacterium]|nr:DUF2769 domain-containing protein [Actinomycetota bacterium]